MALLRDAKARAKRIDLSYFRRSNALKRWQRILSTLAVLAGAGWIVAMAVRGDEQIYTSGRMSPRHAMLESKCRSCHTAPWAQRYTDPATWQERLDAACLTCHDAPVHHANATDFVRGTAASRCSACHVEHQSRNRLADVNDRTCVSCHSDLKVTKPEAHPASCPAGSGHAFDRSIGSFAESHPEFALLAKKSPDPTVVLFNHSVHLNPDTTQKRDLIQSQLKGLASRPGIEKAAGGAFTLSCTYCHAAAATGDYMVPVHYETHCADCHPMKFKDEKVPHEAAAVVRDFLRSRVSKGAAGDKLDEQVYDAEIPLYTSDPDGCMKCHKTDLGATFPASPPVVTVTGIRRGPLGQEDVPRRWFTHSIFNHETHRELRCVECHAGAETSKLTSDVLMPARAPCLKCHSPAGGVSSSCVTCHRYHDKGPRTPDGRLKIGDVIK